MELEVTPPVDESLAQALRQILAADHAPTAPDSEWQRTALAEAVERDESYAFSPRSTRGATRA